MAPPPPSSPSDRSRRGRFTPLLAVSAVLVALALYARRGGLFPGGLPGGAAACGFRALTGAPCPGCGMTRAAGSLLHGDAAAAFAQHPVVLPLAALALATFALAAVEAATGRPRFRMVVSKYALPTVVAFLVLLAATWIVRVVLFPSLSPDPFPPGSPAANLLGG